MRVAHGRLAGDAADRNATGVVDPRADDADFVFGGPATPAAMRAHHDRSRAESGRDSGPAVLAIRPRKRIGCARSPAVLAGRRDLLVAAARTPVEHGRRRRDAAGTERRRGGAPRAGAPGFPRSRPAAPALISALS